MILLLASLPVGPSTAAASAPRALDQPGGSLAVDPVRHTASTLAPVDRPTATAPSSLGASTGPTSSYVNVTVGSDPWTDTFVPSNDEVYVSNQGSDNVSAVSATTNKVVANIALPGSPQGSAYDPSNGVLYVNNDGVTLIDTSTNTVARTISSWPQGYGGGALYDALNSNVYLAQWGNDSVVVIHAPSNQVIATIDLPGTIIEPNGLALDTHNGFVYVAEEAGHGLGVINTTTESLLTTVSTQAGPFAVAYDAADGDLYVPCYNANYLSVVNGSTNTLIANIPIGGGPYGLGSEPEDVAYDPEGQLLYVAEDRGNNLSVVNATQAAEVSDYPLPTQDAWEALDPTTQVMFTVDPNLNQVTAIPLTTLWVGSFGASRNPDAIGRGTYLNATGLGGNPPYSFRYTGLPPGCSTANAGSILCVPTSSGIYAVRVYVNDSAARSATATLSLSVTGAGPTLSSVSVAPSSASVVTGGAVSFTATPTCTGGPCPAGTTYVWSINRALGAFNATTGSVVRFTAGLSGGTTYLFVNATLSGVTVQSSAVPVTITLKSGPERFTVTFYTSPSSCPFAFNGTTRANGTSAVFLSGNYTALAPACPGYAFQSWATRFWVPPWGLTGGSNSDPYTVDVVGNGTVNATYWRAPAVALTGVTVAPGNATVYVLGGPNVGVSFNATPVCVGGPCPSDGSINYSWSWNPSTLTLRNSWGPEFGATVGGLSNFTLFVNATLNATVVESAPVHVAIYDVLTYEIKPATATVDQGGTAELSAYTRVVARPLGSSPSVFEWSVENALGTIAPAIGATVNFTAGDTTGLAVIDLEAVQVGVWVETLNATVLVVAAPPVVAFANATALHGSLGGNCHGGSWPFNDTFLGSGSGGVPPYEFLWSFGDGTADAATQNATHGFVQAGTYMVSFSVHDDPGAVAYSNLTITVVAPTLSCPPAGLRNTSTGGSSLLGLSEAESAALVVVVVAVIAVVALVVLVRRRRKKEGPPAASPEPGPPGPEPPTTP